MKKAKNPIRLTIVGASGRMGQRIIALADQNPNFQFIAGVIEPDSPDIGRLVGKNNAPLVSDIKEVLAKTDVVIDFSFAAVTVNLAKKIASQKKGLVIGTTGLSKKQVGILKSLSQKIPIVFSPNMSVGVNLLFQLVEQAAQRLSGYDIEIIEAHHHLKKDAPSGTAAKLAEIAARASDRQEKDFVYGREGLVGERTKKEIGVHAVRAGDIVGDHTVLLASPGERLELTHRAHSRDAFASGALRAAEWVAHRRPGFYSMLDVLNKPIPSKDGDSR